MEGPVTEMREWWANVYVRDGKTSVGTSAWFMHADRETADEQGAWIGGGLSPDIAFRIHVRLKPEGAPKRYASEANRRAWERNSEWCRGWVKEGIHPEVLGSDDE